MPLNRVDEEMYEKRATSLVSIDDMARFFVAQSKASVLGQAIHPEGALDLARRELLQINVTPSKAEGSGKDMIIKTCIPTASAESVTDFYMSLQSYWRHAESTVNQAKGEWELSDAETKMQLINEFNRKLREYENETARIKSDWENWKLKEIRRISKLKIRIPGLLQPILDELLALGKDEIDK